MLKLIPDDWPLKTDSYNLVTYLRQVLDNQLTVEENNRIGNSLSRIERVNVQYELIEKRKAYVKLSSDS